MIVGVTYHPTSFCVSTKHWYFVFFGWVVFRGASTLVECEFNELEAEVLGGIVCVFVS